MQIVLARLEDDLVLDTHGRVDLGERHTYRAAKKAVACMWKNSGTAADVENAGRYARSEGYTVFCYSGEPEPLARARSDISQ